MSLTVYVDEQPIEPLIITVTDRDLTDLTVTVVGDALPENVVTLADADAGRVQIDFLAPFTEAGVLTVQLQLTSEDDEVDLTEPVEITVLDLSETEAALITPTQAEGWTGVAVSTTDIARAQMTVSMALGADLADEDWLAEVFAPDLRWISLAVAHQAASYRTTTDGGDLASVVASIPGARSLSTGGVSITMSESGASSSTYAVVGLVPLARLALSRVSWRRTRSVHATPFLGASYAANGSRYSAYDAYSGVPDALLWQPLGGTL